MRVLGIESSCDETAAAVVEDGRAVLSSAVASSAKLHARFGGVVPEIAAREHVKSIIPVIESALEESGSSPETLDGIAVTNRPGLVGALLIGVSAAKALAWAWRKPLVAMNHIEAHIYAAHMAFPALAHPYVALVVSGGHTSLYYVRDVFTYELMGATIDDAAGEAFDKVAKVLGLLGDTIHGGPAIARAAECGNPRAVDFPRSLIDEGFDFSFSGIKTAVLYRARGQDAKPPVYVAQPPPAEAASHVAQPPPAGVVSSIPQPRAAALHQPQAGAPVPHQQVADLAASFQEAIVDVLVAKSIRAARERGVTRIVVGGGVAANHRLRERLAAAANSSGLEAYFPPLSFCTDNAVMVAGLGYHHLLAGRTAPADLGAQAQVERV